MSYPVRKTKSYKYRARNLDGVLIHGYQIKREQLKLSFGWVNTDVYYIKDSANGLIKINIDTVEVLN